MGMENMQGCHAENMEKEHIFQATLVSALRSSTERIRAMRDLILILVLNNEILAVVGG